MRGARPSHWSEYLELLRWLVPDVFRHARGRMIAVLALSGLGAGLRAAAAAVIVLFVDAQQKGRSAEVLGVALPSAPTPLNLALWGGAGLLFTLGAVGASYRCDRLIYDLARTYVEDWSRAVLRFVAAGGAVRVAGVDERAGPRPAARLIAGSSFQLVRVVISALSVVLPAITGLAAIAVLFATQALLTAILIPIGLGYFALMGRLQRRTLRDVEHRIEAHRSSRRDAVQMLHALDRQRFPVGGEPRWVVEYPERSWLATSLDAYRNVIFAKRRVGYLGELFQGVSLLLILLVFGGVIASRGASWTVLLTYAVALGYAVRSLGSAARFVTAASRALPKVRRYLGFLRAHPDLAAVGRHRVGGFGEAWPVLATGEPRLPGGLDRLALKPGEPLLCLHPVPLGNASLEVFCLALAGGDPELAVAFESELFAVQGLGAIPERRLAEHLPIAADPAAQARAVREKLEALGIAREFDEAIGDPERAIASTDEERWSAPLRLGLRLLPGLLSGRQLVALDHETFERLGAERRHRLLAALGDRIVLITAAAAPAKVAEPVRTAIVVGFEGVQGIGDLAWFEAIARPTVAGWSVSEAVSEAALDDGLLDDDSDDDEE